MPQSVDRALDVLDAVAASADPVPAKALARRLGCGLSTVYELLGTLTARGHLVRTPAGYALGYRVPALHHAFQRQMQVSDEVQELLVRMRKTVGTDTYFSAYRDGDIAVLAGTATAHPATGGFSVGHDAVPHATAHGKVLLAALPRAARLRRLTASGMPAVTPRTITSPELLDVQLRRVRREGLAVEIEECAAGVACVAVPVPGALRAVSAALPVEEFRRHGRRVTEALRHVAAEAAKLA
ncbi:MULTISPECIES: IclR family transcriptional regulator [Streptomyces]|uniref:IclR family transcriptional regulator n=1 Tax=Streptomyces TaxID=1883 RepID=UPI0019A9B326|nr:MULTISPECIES: IclR family transcriptional regulator C-terminal domain-containing protein [Streptomyces]MCC2279448.1 helix-turn-helix domain-containing protein [Streptomyces sp. ET3-23]GHF16361.1 IclR family transcriptional regulator [Streptomyces morookaense]